MLVTRGCKRQNMSDKTNYGIFGGNHWFSVSLDNVMYLLNKYDESYGQPDERSIPFLDTLVSIFSPDNKFSDYEIDSGPRGYHGMVEIIPGAVQFLMCGPLNRNFKYTTSINITGMGANFLTERNLWRKFFKLILPFVSSFNRSDWFIDEVRCSSDDSVFPLKTEYEMVKSHAYISRWTGEPNIVLTFGSSACNTGFGSLTITHGSKSNVLMRTYDKASEQNVDYYWCRHEFEIKDDSITRQIVMLFLSSEDDHEFFDYIATFALQSIRFINFDNDDKRRCSTFDGWLNLLDGAREIDKIRPSDKGSNNFYLLTESFLKSYSAFLAEYCLIFDEADTMDFVMFNLYARMRKFSQKDIVRLNSHLRFLNDNRFFTKESIDKFIEEHVEQWHDNNNIDSKLSENEFGKGVKIDVRKKDISEL